MPYFGPEVTAPLASFLAGLVGFFLLTGRRIVAEARRLFRRLGGGFGRRKAG